MQIKGFKSPIEYVFFIIFVSYLVIPIETPPLLAKLIDSPLGIIGLFLITVALFIYTHPILGVLYIFVAYELIRRSTTTNLGKISYIQYTPTQKTRDEDIKKMNPSVETTLEESVVLKMSPIGHGNMTSFLDTTFKPIAEKTHSASQF
jgi:hypothetical protein